MPDSFVFMRSFHASAQLLPDAERLTLFDAICAYALDGVEDGDAPLIVQVAMASVKPMLDSNARRREANRRNGQRGGAPLGNKDARTTQINPNQPKSTEEQAETRLYGICHMEDAAACADDVLLKTQQEHQEVLEAAKHAGFPETGAVYDALVSLYAEHGKQAVIDALTSCGEHSAATLAYLRACLRPRAREEPERYDMLWEGKEYA